MRVKEKEEAEDQITRSAPLPFSIFFQVDLYFSSPHRHWIYSRITCTSFSSSGGFSCAPTQHPLKKRGSCHPRIETTNCNNPPPPPSYSNSNKNKSPRACAQLRCRTVYEPASAGGKTCAVTVRRGQPTPLESRLRTFAKSAFFFPIFFFFFILAHPPPFSHSSVVLLLLRLFEIVWAAKRARERANVLEIVEIIRKDIFIRTQWGE